MWPWRDWLVGALNNNMPFDQFTIEMLAGDLLENASQEQILATAFNRNHMFNGEGGRIAEETRIENVFDRTETTGTVWLGLTMTCCRCHDHKYDPITQKEYFQLFAFFNNTSETGRSGRGKTEPVLKYLQPAERSKIDALKVQIAEIEKDLSAPNQNLDRQQASWETTIQAKLGTIAKPTKLGPWWQIGPIAMNGRQAFDEDLGPEKAVDLESKIGQLSWSKKPDLIDARVYQLPSTIGATYFYRKLQAASERTIELSFGSDDAIKVLVNGKQVLSNFASRAAAPDQERVEVN